MTLLLCGLLMLVPTASADVLKGIRARGMLHCGVSEGIAGFSMPDAAGRWQGLDADFCRALAAAVLEDPEKVRFVPLRAAARFPALQAGKVDVVARNTTWTLHREAIIGVRFPAVLFYDSQGFMVPAALPVASAAELAGASICVVKGTTSGRNLSRWATRLGIEIEPLVLDSVSAAREAFFAGRCAAWSSDRAQLASVRSSAPGGASNWRILPDQISKEPVGPAIWGGDERWAMIVRWVLFALIRAEEDGVTQANLDERIAAGDTVQFFATGQEHQKLLGEAMAMVPGWSVRAVRAVGNYGELFERHLAPHGIERGLNHLWTQGGLMYAPPVD
ncbi:amino acid ABC transporter substrate-binding protein [Thioalkalicoccus limnaeus]|uniref:Amino acid ABC transporter substrate-binding protein n=1 Tax=Thioalkalicoccus limnaeus TaxID=120681 RepID=A0ABV4BE79_9GAMM